MAYSEQLLYNNIAGYVKQKKSLSSRFLQINTLIWHTDNLSLSIKFDERKKNGKQPNG